jgi:glycosyltransferase involved in cell wall biosynthesis
LNRRSFFNAGMRSLELVSCIVPVHDGEAFLAEALDSILAQDHRPIEVVVVDNGSTDGSAALAESFGDPVRVIRQADLGPPAGRNRGLAAARGEFVAFLDADDVFVAGKLSRQLERFAAVPDLGVSLGLAENFWEPGLEEEEARYRASGKVYASHVFGTMLARRAVFDVVGPIDATRVHGDQVEWFSRLADSDVKVDVIDEIVMRRRMHPASLSHTQPDLDSYLELVKLRRDRRHRAA